MARPGGSPGVRGRCSEMDMAVVLLSNMNKYVYIWSIRPVAVQGASGAI